jgi:tRNA-dihydrouridine synthase A
VLAEAGGAMVAAGITGAEALAAGEEAGADAGCCWHAASARVAKATQRVVDAFIVDVFIVVFHGAMRESRRRRVKQLLGRCGPRPYHWPMQSTHADAWRLCVAPMMDWTDRHCRYFHRLLSPNARLYTEMVTAAALAHGDRARLLAHNPEEHPVALQVGGADPAELAQAARWGEQAGYAEINLNAGCPSDRVQSGRFGACLMREPALVADCVRAMREAVRVPVTVKCRIGVDDQDDDGDLFAFAGRMADAGVEVLVVHARKAWLQGLSPKQNREVPPLNYARVHRLKHEFPELTVVINGGIDGLPAVQEHLRHVDGVMLGRLAYHEPYALARIDAALTGAVASSREEIMSRMRDYVERQRARGVRLAAITRHVLGLYHGEAGGKAFRRVLSERTHAADAGWEAVEAALLQVKGEVVPRRRTAKDAGPGEGRVTEGLCALQRTK